MNKIEFIVNKHSEYPSVDILIDGKNLIDLLKVYEMPFAIKEGAANIAGGYVGLPPKVALPPSQHFWGNPDPLHNYDGKTEILVCGGCGEPGCWPFLVKIEADENRIIWKEFEQPFRKNKWIYDEFAPFEFLLRQYEEALQRTARDFST